MSQETGERKRALKKPIEEIRAELMKDPDTARIAKAVSMELPAYVEKVLEYLQYPDREPMFNIASDEELQAVGLEPMGEKEVHDLFAGIVSGELDPANKFQKSGFEGASGGRKATATEVPASGVVPSGPKDEAKRQELMDQIKKGGTPRG
jgi:hypothetical protein